MILLDGDQGGFENGLKYKEVGKYGNDELRAQYKRSIETSIRHFEKRLQILQDQDLISKTLVIFTSDHGELLGEYGGLVDHGRPPCPELIYVPTIFIHPSIAPEIIETNIMRHVDLYPTIASILFPTFAWCILKKTNGGAIATIGATRTAFGSIEYGCGYLAVHFWQAYATSDTVSEMLTKAQNDYITNIPNELITVEEFILIGDPSLKMGGY